MISNNDLLTDKTVVNYLAGRHLIDAGTATVDTLGGGVSNVVLSVRDSTHHVVVKQSLVRLRVAEEWLAPRARIFTEADALAAAAVIAPGSVPAVIDRDYDRHAIVIEHSPDGWADWKQSLLSGHIEQRVASRLGALIANWHVSTDGGSSLPASFDDTQAFELLRVAPYYRTTAGRAGPLGPVILSLAEQMAERRRCFVHGDFSPKNVLVGRSPGASPESCWVIDFEVAHYGDPAFDLAFLVSHLIMKSLHMPSNRRAYDGCIDAFSTGYVCAAGVLAPDWPYVMRHVGCLLMARVRGKSPAEYLNESQREATWLLGTMLVGGEPHTLAELFELRDEVLA